jgi:hypothetical protein
MEEFAGVTSAPTGRFSLGRSIVLAHERSQVAARFQRVSRVRRGHFLALSEVCPTGSPVLAPKELAEGAVEA